jgi:KDO2-lipid IV(A) lauroyltransferase
MLGPLVGALVAVLRRLGPDRAGATSAAVLRTVGPWLPVSAVARRQLRAAFPQHDDAWHRATLRGVWDNLGRTSGEYAALDKVWDFDLARPNQGRVETDAMDLFRRLRDDGQPALVFTAHLGNWELPAVAAHAHGLPTAVLYRMPNDRGVARVIQRIRSGLMGRLIRARPEAAFELAGALEQGLHVGMLVDQHWSRGVDVTFFGRPCKANPTLARLARQLDCPVHGVRTIRLAGGRFRVTATEAIDLPRDASGRVDVPGAMQAITDVVECWIREHPDQWLWLHRRWR